MKRHYKKEDFPVSKIRRYLEPGQSPLAVCYVKRHGAEKR